MFFFWGAGDVALSQAAAPAEVKGDVNQSPPDSAPRFSGMDEAVNDSLAEKAGRPSREPYLNTEGMGDLWNLLLLSAGGICGFILGRYWHLLWDKPKLPSGATATPDSACENTH
jgi:hypothetical protein